MKQYARSRGEIGIHSARVKDYWRILENSPPELRTMRYKKRPNKNWNKLKQIQTFSTVIIIKICSAGYTAVVSVADVSASAIRQRCFSPWHNDSRNNWRLCKCGAVRSSNYLPISIMAGDGSYNNMKRSVQRQRTTRIRASNVFGVKCIQAIKTAHSSAPRRCKHTPLINSSNALTFYCTTHCCKTINRLTLFTQLYLLCICEYKFISLLTACILLAMCLRIGRFMYRWKNKYLLSDRRNSEIIVNYRRRHIPFLLFR